ncbi:hypothetical protein ELI18_02405 [Rhizobium leguminosarum]|uniref:Uncharacterized protein n=1 Tax=Rhizobium leguminosarum TaxID=384 RepID=A0ABD7PXX8_RHILE|nr:hypothetical protein ELI19_02400 [Rhizobium leguminosarum]TAW46086.1 hypothetical protein ELI18_02405 [Rhizobium leguminosarum]
MFPSSGNEGRRPSGSCFPKIGIDFRKARCEDRKSWSVLCASESTHGASALHGPAAGGSAACSR